MNYLIQFVRGERQDVLKRNISKILIRVKRGNTEIFRLFVVTHEYCVMENDGTLINSKMDEGNITYGSICFN